MPTPQTALSAIVATCMVLGVGSGTPLRAQHADNAGYAFIGKSGKLLACDFDRRWWNPDTCEGFANFNLFDPGRRFDAGEWILGRKWEATPTITKRHGEALLTITMVKNPRALALKDLDRRGTVVARLQADPEGPAEERFKVGGKYTSGQRFTGDFFVIIDRYREVVGDNDEVSRQIAHWRLFGLRSTGELVPMPANGSFRFCKMPEHEPQIEAALFVTCKTRHELEKLAKSLGRDFMLRELRGYLTNASSREPTKFAGREEVGRLYERAYQESFLETASLPCGMGCCVTEFGFDMPGGSLDAAEAGSPRAMTRSVSPRSR